MKYRVLGAVRRLGLLPLFDKARFQLRWLAARASNRRFLRRNPTFVPPPLHLAYDAHNNVNWQIYDEIGRAHARVFADAIAAHAPPGPLNILEWGCGPGRLIRHLPQMLGDRALRIVGSDYNEETVEWCRTHFPGIDFALNDLMPPLPFPDASFDAIFNFSVFTHLSAEAHDAWAAELRRVLKPGGVLISTTHGDNYRYLLSTASERARYDAGAIVTQAQYEEGKKYFFAVHPPQYVEQVLFADFTDVRCLPVPETAGMKQSLWLARRPQAVEA